MPIVYYHDTDIFTSTCHTLVNTVNCYGRMGKGLALQVAQRYPLILPRYQTVCTRQALRPGRLLLSREYLPERLIVNAATKDWYWHPSRIEWVNDALEAIVRKCQEWDLRSIALPPLGCGNGGLSWDEVGPLMARILGELPIRIEVYLRGGDREY